MIDRINPTHYKTHPSGVECITITEWFNFNLGNLIKYVWRAYSSRPDSDPEKLVDLRKAQWYLSREIARIEALNDQISKATTNQETDLTRSRPHPVRRRPKRS